MTAFRRSSGFCEWTAKVRGGAEWLLYSSARRHRAPSGRLAFFAREAKYSAWTVPGRAETWADRANVPADLATLATRRIDIVRTVWFAERHRAKDRAYRWFCSRTGRRFKSLHKKAKLTKAERASRVARLSSSALTPEKGG